MFDELNVILDTKMFALRKLKNALRLVDIYVRVKRDNLRNVASVAHFWLTFGQHVIFNTTHSDSCNVDCRYLGSCTVVLVP